MISIIPVMQKGQKGWETGKREVQTTHGRLLSMGIFLLLLLGIQGFSTAQDPYLQNGDRDAEAVATRLMRTYQQELGMTVEQAVRFRDKIEEFELRREEVKSRNLPTQEALGLLEALSRQETAEMANILTRPQLKAYRRIKPDLQPVRLVVGQVEVPE